MEGERFQWKYFFIDVADSINYLKKDEVQERLFEAPYSRKRAKNKQQFYTDLKISKDPRSGINLMNLLTL